MTYDLTIGRVDVRNGVVQSVEKSADRLRLSGTFEPDASGTNAIDQRDVFAQQLRGLPDNRDEPVVPLTSIKRPELDGFYRVRSTEIEELARVTHESGIVRWSADLERVVGGYGAPFFDVWTQADLLDNTEGVASGRLDTYLPPSAVGASVDGDVESEDGLLTSSLRTLPGSKGRETITFQVAAADMYDGAARIEQVIDGVWYPIVGRQIAALPLTSIRLNNGVLRVDFPTLGTMRLQRFKGDGTGWSAVTHTFSTVRLDTVFVGTLTRFVDAVGDFAVLRNSPERVAIQALYESDQSSEAAGPVAFELTRGAIYVNCKAGDAVRSNADSWGADSADASSSFVAYAIELTAADADGNKWQMVSSEKKHVSTTTSTVMSVLDARFAVGIWDTATEVASVMRDQIFGASALHQVAVSR